MTTTTITFRVDVAEQAEIVSRAERDKVSVSDYVRVRLGLRGEGPHDDGNGNGDGRATAGSAQVAVQSQLADHEQRLTALEANRAAHS